MGQTFLPVFRSLLASQLVEKYGFSQVEVAMRLRITEAAVSQYLHEKRAKRHLQQQGLRRRVERMARRAALQISQNRISSDDAMKMACQLCAQMTA
jgi:predicted transcriptional regulator